MVSSLLEHIHYDIVFICLYIKNLRVYERFHLVLCHAAFPCEVFQKFSLISSKNGLNLHKIISRRYYAYLTAIVSSKTSHTD